MKKSVTFVQLNHSTMKTTRFFTLAAMAGLMLAGCSKKHTSNPGSTTDAGVVIQGVTWATRNVDTPGKFAKNEQSFGMLYQWNRKKAWPATNTPATGWEDADLNAEWEASNNPCPAGWRLPTKEDWDKLCGLEYVSTAVHDVQGGRFVDGDNSLFLPAAGYRAWKTGSFFSSGSHGEYYSSTPAEYDEQNAFALYLNPDDAHVGTYAKGTGRSVRCVKEE